MRLTLFCNHSAFIGHLEQEVAWYRDQLIHERQRAERAIDELLRVRVQAGPTTVPTPGETRAMESEIEKILRDSEFSTAGIAEPSA